jgi:hypothetical protein
VAAASAAGLPSEVVAAVEALQKEVAKVRQQCTYLEE